MHVGHREMNKEPMDTGPDVLERTAARVVGTILTQPAGSKYFSRAVEGGVSSMYAFEPKCQRLPLPPTPPPLKRAPLSLLPRADASLKDPPRQSWPPSQTSDPQRVEIDA